MATIRARNSKYIFQSYGKPFLNVKSKYAGIELHTYSFEDNDPFIIEIFKQSKDGEKTVHWYSVQFFQNKNELILTDY